MTAHLADPAASGREAGGAGLVRRRGLESALARVLAPGAFCALTGPAGIGKSSLAAGLAEGRRAVTVAVAAEGDVDASQVLTRAVGSVGGPEATALVSALGQEAGSAETLAAAAAWLSRHVELVVVEDVNRLARSEVGLLVAASAASAVPWVVTSREPLEVDGCHEVVVPPLAPDEARELVLRVLPGASPDVADLVLRRGEGNPLHLLQCARLLVENGAVEVGPTGSRLARPEQVRDVPVSLRDFVLGRLRLLPPLERRVVSTAAVLGEQVDLDVLAHLAGGGREVVAELVSRLVDRGLLRAAEAAATGPDPRVAFVHALVRDAAYGELPVEERVALHRAAAEWYAVLPVVHVLDAQAQHLEAAVRLGGADCELLRQAVEAMVLFARSVEVERSRQSRDVLVRARELVDARPECQVDTLQLELAQAVVSFALGEHEAGAIAAGRATELARVRGDQGAEAAAHLALGRLRRSIDAEEALAQLALAETGFAGLSDDGGLARVEIERSWVAQRQQGIAQQLTHMERAYQLAIRSGDPRLQASAAQDLAMHHAFALGRPGFEHWSARARECSRPEDVSLEPKLDVAEAFLAVFELVPRRGLDPSGRALRAGQELGLSFVLRNAVTTQLDLLLLDGRFDELEDLLPTARAVADRQATPWQHLQYSLIEARLRQRQGDPAGAAALLDEVARHELAERTVLRRDLAEARAWVALERGWFEEARALAGQAVLLDEEMGERCPPLRPRLVDVLGLLGQGRGPSLGDVATLRALGRETGLTTIAELATRWLLVEDLRQGWSVDLYHLSDVDVLEAQALDLEIEALSTRTWDRLQAAAEVWGRLGTTVWQARALLWHSELTGTEHAEADRLLEVLQSPAGLAEQLRAQVRGLRD